MSLTIIDVMRPEVEDYLDHLRTGKNISDSTVSATTRAKSFWADKFLFINAYNDVPIIIKMVIYINGIP